jgi:hypothetical protein
MHLARLAASRTFWTAGNSKAIRTPMIAITTNSSISVKALLDPGPEEWFHFRMNLFRMNIPFWARHIGPEADPDIPISPPWSEKPWSPTGGLCSFYEGGQVENDFRVPSGA